MLHNLNEKQKTIGQDRRLPQIKPRDETRWQLFEGRKKRQKRLQELKSDSSQIKTYKYPGKYSNQQKNSVSQIEL